ncbi:hypothetical protein E2I00_015470 [Balaenoptera physalus]|uniref:G-protein coupled receptors family 1 profile domain-containing protein n=1 Tax=Balaenoptera physalus TaxID=9770 RepID=A0A643C593_BALPH|nr:hypothetical protein E2I00_015470 [Balaenoptera physalus]
MPSASSAGPSAMAAPNATAAAAAWTNAKTPSIIYTINLVVTDLLVGLLVVYHVAVTLSSLNSCMDPIVYCFVTSSFQTTVRGLFRRHGAEREPNSCDVVSMRKSSKDSAHHHILGARPRALTQALANGPEA